jgi:uncharacterized protein YegL
MIFLVDISGSMAGSAMENTKNTVQLFLRSLPERARFNIVAFESNFRTLFPGWLTSTYLSTVHKTSWIQLTH